MTKKPINLKTLIKTLPNRGEGGKGERRYVGWSPYEDALCHEDGWSGRLIYNTWKDFDFKLDDLNLVADFYFGVHHDSESCKDCDATGYNPETKKISDDYYDFGKTGRRWVHSITQDEAEALWKKHRLFEFERTHKECPTALEVNAWSLKGIGHDAINRCILIETRAKRLGVHGKCKTCEGVGEVRLSKDTLSLYIWILHPRKGVGRGIHIKSVDPSELDDVKAWLKKSFQLHQEHFSWALKKKNKEF